MRHDRLDKLEDVFEFSRNKKCILQLKQFLVGKKLLKLQISQGEQFLRFITEDGGSLLLIAEGDCCSESWFADVCGIDSLIGSVITDVQIKNLPDPIDARTRQASDSAYGIFLITETGMCDIVFRNSSNGYYCGWCSVTAESACFGLKFRDITEDFSA